MRHVVVTGASTGIGEASVKILLENGYKVFGSLRTQKEVKEAGARFGEGFVPLLMDVVKHDQVKKSADLVIKTLAGEPLYGLVNNAGILAAGPALELDLEEYRKIFEVNFFGLIQVSKSFAPLMAGGISNGRARSRIVNISSIAGKYAPPFTAPYSASKHAVEALSDCMRRELNMLGIHVVVLESGYSCTPIFDKVENDSDGKWMDTPYAKVFHKFIEASVEFGKNGFPPEKVGRRILQIMNASSPKARYMTLGGFSQRIQEWSLPSRLSDGMLDALYKKMFFS